MWLSLVEHVVRDDGVGGSNPLIPTIFLSPSRYFSKKQHVKNTRTDSRFYRKW